MGLSIDQIIGKVKPPVRSVWVCLDGDLWARHDELSKQIDEIRAAAPVGKMASAPGASDLSAELRQVEAAMREAEVEFQFRGISSYKRAEIMDRFPAKTGGGWDSVAGAHAWIAASAHEPTMSEESARKLGEALHHAAWVKLFNGAWQATEGSADVPFSGRASA